MRRILTVSIGCAIAIVASLLLARVHPFGDAGLYTAKAAETSILERPRVQPEVRTILVEKCADCHSNQTHAPFYGWFAPVSWLLERDIVKGRKAMNFSLWDTYSADQQQILTAKMVQEMKEHRMPLPQYRLIHWRAGITDADLRALTQWTHAMSGLDAASVTQPAGNGDPLRGKEVFEKRCTGCHDMTKDREGPRLQGVYGRISGGVAGFVYSPALKKAHIVWDNTSLERWLTNPDALVPDNNMEFPVTKPKERSDLISYLKQRSGK